MTKNCITAGTLIVNSDNTKLLMHMHKKLNRWIYAGGHVDAGELPHQAAIREALEETGYKVELLDSDIQALQIKDELAYSLPNPMRIMLENVPYKDEKHVHFDMLYLAHIVDESARDELPEGESTQIRWMAREEIVALPENQIFSNVREVALLGLDIANKLQNTRQTNDRQE